MGQTQIKYLRRYLELSVTLFEIHERMIEAGSDEQGNVQSALLDEYMLYYAPFTESAINLNNAPEESLSDLERDLLCETEELLKALAIICWADEEAQRNSSYDLKEYLRPYRILKGGITGRHHGLVELSEHRDYHTLLDLIAQEEGGKDLILRLEVIVKRDRPKKSFDNMSMMEKVTELGLEDELVGCEDTSRRLVPASLAAKIQQRSDNTAAVTVPFVRKFREKHKNLTATSSCKSNLARESVLSHRL